MEIYHGILTKSLKNLQNYEKVERFGGSGLDKVVPNIKMAQSDTYGRCTCVEVGVKLNFGGQHFCFSFLTFCCQFLVLSVA